MKTVLIVLGVLAALVVLPAIALPLLVLAGIGVGVAALFGGAAAFALPAIIAVALLGLAGLLLRLLLVVFGLALGLAGAVLGAILGAAGAVLGAVVAVVVLPLALLPLLAPVVLIGLLVWWAVRASRRPAALPAPPAG